MLFNQKTQLNLTMVSISTKLFSSSFFMLTILLSLMSTVSESNTSNHSEGFKDTISDKSDFMAEASIIKNGVILNNLNRRNFEHVNIVAINSTSVRIRFTLPVWLNHLFGHMKLHYTTDLNIPRSLWNIQKFAEPKRLFDTPNFEYHLGNLSPDTTYFFQIQVIIEVLQSERESEIYKLYLPPIPSMSTTSTTVLPFVQSHMPSEPKDQFDIHIRLTPNDVNVDAFQTQIKLNDLPLPINKYINVAKISYRSDESMELSHAFRVPNENGKLILDGLEPNKRYKAWIDLYLANGKTVSSNAIEFTTKERPPKINKIDTSANEAEVHRENEVTDARHFFGIGVEIAIGIVIVLYFLLRKQPTAKNR